MSDAVSSPTRLDADGFRQLAHATDAQMADLDLFCDLLTEANAVMNLVGPDSMADFWGRHVWDSAQLLDLAGFARTWADIGAGAGFPGVVLAILSKGKPGAHIWLIDSLQKRCRFLQEVVDRLNLPATVVWGRAEEQSLKVDVVTARAVAPLEKLLAYAQPYLDGGAQGLFMKGGRLDDELITARKVWHLDSETHVSRSDPRGRILSVRSLRAR